VTSKGAGLRPRRLSTMRNTKAASFLRELHGFLFMTFGNAGSCAFTAIILMVLLIQE
jgi:hypothetical protein